MPNSSRTYSLLPAFAAVLISGIADIEAQSDSAEVALAMSAAPTAITVAATIYAVREGRVITLRQGTNAVSCLVSRDLHPGSTYPICFDAEGSRTLLKQELLQNRLRSERKSEADVVRLTAEAYAKGELVRPTRMAVTYMMSPRQVLFSSPGPEGRKVGRWWPHLMISDPNLASGSLGLLEGAQFDAFSLDAEGEGRLQFVVKVPFWSDGTRAP